MSKLKKGDIVVGKSSKPYALPYNIKNGELSIAYKDTNYSMAINGGIKGDLGAQVNDIKFSANGRYTYIGFDVSPYFVIRDNNDYTELTFNITQVSKCEAISCLGTKKLILWLPF